MSPERRYICSAAADNTSARLNTPVAYFIYLVSQPITFPIPLKLVEEYGEDWWKPEHIICNGPFRLVQFGGNLDQHRWKFVDSAADALREYLDGRADYLGGIRLENILEPVPASEFIHTATFATWGLNLIPELPPLNDIRIRRALVHAIDRKQLDTIWGSDSPSSNGGIVPPGIPGHSPELGLEFDPEQARQLLAQAGYSTTENFPVLKYYYGEFANWRIQEELRRQLLAHLGVRVELIPLPSTGPRWVVEDSLLQWMGWTADYPDPDNFLRQSPFYILLRNRGWHHPRLEKLLEEAVHTTDRARRLAMYREADRILVNEEAVVMPLTYSSTVYVALLKPWVRGYKLNALNNYSLKDIVIEPH